MRAIQILGVRVDDVNLAEAEAICREALRTRLTLRVVTPNAEFVMAAQEDPVFRATLNGSGLAIPDGAGLLLAGRLLGTPLRAQVAGTDLADRLAGICAREGYRLFLLGAAAGVAEAAAAKLVQRYPGLTIAGTYAGDSSPAGDAETCARVRQAGPVDVILVAYGMKKQEAWLARNQAALAIPVGVGVGGVFDFFAGRVPRAPLVVRRAGFDWLFRLIVQPWRWRRQLALPRFLVAVLVYRVSKLR
jgi:N-acetylglucosaminyldiphosphoundecaprenol N-acetyl-beta-D-mannosaminyltransferase